MYTLQSCPCTVSNSCRIFRSQGLITYRSNVNFFSEYMEKEIKNSQPSKNFQRIGFERGQGYVDLLSGANNFGSFYSSMHFALLFKIF